MASSSTGTLSQWERLPDELLLRVLEHAMPRWRGSKSWCGALRGVSRQWRAVHDAACQSLYVRDGVTDDIFHMLCPRLPALNVLSLSWVSSLTEDGLLAVGGLTTLTRILLSRCRNVTDAVLRELRGITGLTELFINDCPAVTDVGLWELRGLTKLTYISLLHTSTSQAGRDALKAALPTLRIFWRAPLQY